MVRTKLLGMLILMVLPVLVFVGVANAQTFRSGETTTVSKGEVIDSSLWTAGSTIDIAGKVNGDVFCAGQNVTISGQINGDVICAAQTITLSGKVSGDVRLAGQTTVIGGNVKGSASAAGQTVTLENRGSVGSDASFGGQDVSLHGSIARDVMIGSQNATVAGTIGRNITGDFERLTLTGDAKVNGTVNYTSPQKASVNEGAQIVGKTTYTERQQQEQDTTGFNLGAALFWMAMLLVTAIALVLLFPRLFHQATNQAVKSPKRALLALLLGLAVSIAAPITIILLLLTVFGIPLALLALIAWLLVMSVSGAFAAYYLGRLMWPGQINAVVIVTVGALILLIVTMVPFIGFLITLIASWLGTGLIVLEFKKRYEAPKYDIKSLK